jgi:hypothetical protein
MIRSFPNNLLNGGRFIVRSSRIYSIIRTNQISKPIPMHHHQCFTDHLLPFGNPMPVIDPTRILRICMQNTQHDFQIYGDGLEITTISNNLQSLGINMFIPISPNVNWINPYYWFHTRQLFHYNFHHVNLSAVSSDIGLDPLYLHKHLMGGVAILTLGLWPSKVSTVLKDESGFGTFTITTIQGKRKKFVTFIAAYIAVKKGSDVGSESLYAQQLTIYEKQSFARGSLPSPSFCLRSNAFACLNDITLSYQQQQQHAIILFSDANQSLSECFRGSQNKPFSIEWLRIQCGMEDPFRRWSKLK